MNCEFCKDTKKIKDGGILKSCYCASKPQKSQDDDSKMFILAKEIDSLLSRVCVLEETLSALTVAKKGRGKFPAL